MIRSLAFLGAATPVAPPPSGNIITELMDGAPFGFAIVPGDPTITKCYTETTGASATTECTDGQEIGTIEYVPAGLYITYSTGVKPVFQTAAGRSWIELQATGKLFFEQSAYTGTGPMLMSIAAINELGAHLWVNIPAQADTNYVTQLATLVRDNLNPALKCYVEYANEWWNYASGFETYPYLEALRAGKSYDFTEMAGGRSTEVMLAWSAVFAGQMHRTVRVAGMHTGYLGTVDEDGNILYRGIDYGFLEAPGWVAEVPGRVAPNTVHDAIALTGYFNVADWEETITTATANYAAGYDMVVAKAFAHVETLRTSNYPYFQQIADLYGMAIVMYEGGSHAINPGGLSNPSLADSLLLDFNTGSEIYDVYDAMFKAWHEFSTFPFNQFVGISNSAFGPMAHLNDTAQPRYQAMLDYNDGTLPSIGGGDLDPLPLSTKLVVTGHSIPAASVKGALQAAITAMGGTSDVQAGTGPYASAEYRWGADPADPVAVKALMQGGTPGAIFLGGEGHGGAYGSPARKSVNTYTELYGFPPPSGGNDYAARWHGLAADAGCVRTFYFNFWRDDVPRVWGSSWRASLNDEVPLWDGIIDYVNTNRDPGTPPLRLMPWLQVFMAIYDAIGNGDVTGIVMGDLFTDDVHNNTPVGRWAQIATILFVGYHIDPDNLPANAGTDANISSGLANQLRPIIRAACLATSRAWLS